MKPTVTKLINHIN